MSAIIKSRSVHFFGSMWNRAYQSFDPLISRGLSSVTRPSLLFRMDSRTPSHLHQANGFEEVLSVEEIHQTVRRSRLEAYQNANESPFALGACANFDDLDQGYIDGNKHLAKSRHLFVFFNHSASLGLLKIQTGMDLESGRFDFENEELVLGHVDLSRLLVATGPQYRDDFDDGLTVPNEMAYFNEHVPQTVSKDDISSEENLISWLLNNDCITQAAHLCKTIYHDANHDRLSYLFREKPSMIDRVTQLLEKAQHMDIEMALQPL
jgi:hypothetical protein